MFSFIDYDSTMVFAKKLANNLWQEQKSDSSSYPLALLFHGDLGAGKTHFIKTIIKTWLRDDDLSVVSPTFSLVNTYEKNNIKILHGDFYRIKHPAEAEELNLPDYYLNHHVLLEWPEKIEGWLPKNYLGIHIDIDIDKPEARKISLNPHGMWYESWYKKFLIT